MKIEKPRFRSEEDARKFIATGDESLIVRSHTVITSGEAKRLIPNPDHKSATVELKWRKL